MSVPKPALLSVLSVSELAHDDATAAAWLFGINDDLGGEAPIEVLQQGAPEERDDVVRLATLWTTGR